MKIGELNARLAEMKQSGIDPDEVDVDVTSVIVEKAFDDAHNVNYRLKAIQTLLHMRVPFVSDGNIQYDMIKIMMKINCPYCAKDMDVTSGGGNHGGYAYHFFCENKHEVTISLPADGINVSPDDSP